MPFISVMIGIWQLLSCLLKQY